MKNINKEKLEKKENKKNKELTNLEYPKSLLDITFPERITSDIKGIEDFIKICNENIEKYENIYTIAESAVIFIDILQSISNLCQTYVKSLEIMIKEYKAFKEKNANVKTDKKFSNWTSGAVYVAYKIRRNFAILKDKAESYFDALNKLIDEPENI